jgi:PAS domain S-box-containing protein
MQSSTITPRQQQRSLEEEEIIVSKTDTKGKILYVNRSFMRISGFAEPELLGQPHNIIRHPDMPRGVFKLMWDTLQSGNEFFGYVKNLCKDGSYYWVIANVTQEKDATGALRGYYSVRRRPADEAVRMIEPVYADMLAIEARAHNRNTVVESLECLQRKLDELRCSYTSFVLQLENRG